MPEDTYFLYSLQFYLYLLMHLFLCVQNGKSTLFFLLYLFVGDVKLGHT